MIRLTPRRRVVVACMVSWVVGLIYLVVAVNLVLSLVRLYFANEPTCIGDSLISVNRVFSICTGTTRGDSTVWIELAVSTVVAAAITYGLARWCSAPIRAMAETVERVGPTSLGLRLGADGPFDETRRLSDAVDTMLDRVAEGYEAQQRFAANASHELRTPLATQRALIEVSLTSALTPDQLDLLSRQLLATNERNERLIEGLLVLAETERGLMSRVPLRLDLITAAAIETIRPTAAERGIELRAALDPVAVPGEQPLLERLVSNLLQNAVKYNQPGGWIEVQIRDGGVLRVGNTGARVPPDQVRGLFEPFRRASGDRLEHGGGVGLGLTIARSIVAAHAGSIGAIANPDGGLTVDVRLPVG